MVYGIGLESDQAHLRFMIDDSSLLFSVTSKNTINYSPLSQSGNPRSLIFPCSIGRTGELHYIVWSIDCTKIYNSSNTSELNGFNGDFYNIKMFVDGNLEYNTYYSIEQYDYLKNNKDTLNLKYFTIGRCSAGSYGYWHYAKMNIYCMRLYNRGLSEEEIIDNYNTTKAYYSAIIGN